MTNEEKNAQSVIVKPGCPAMDLAATLSKLYGNDCYRLYFLPTSFKWPARIIATLCLDQSRAMLEVVHTHRYENLFPEWRRFMGLRAIPFEIADSFSRQLKELGIWTLQDCRTDSSDGLLSFHVAASEGKDHCISMLNPQLHEDHSYAEIIDLYSRTFFQGKLWTNEDGAI
jgi:hypothetical protein